MAFDRTRPVPWKRIVVPFLVYAALINAVFLLVSRRNAASLAIGTVAGGIIYVAVAALMTKFGWEPPRFGGKRAAGGSSSGSTGSAGSPASARSKPAAASSRSKPPPTRRTNATNPKAKPR